MSSAHSKMAKDKKAPALPKQTPNVGELIGKKLFKLRKERRMTLDELAARTGFTKGYLSKIENYKNVPPIGTLSKIAQAFACDIGQFFQQDDDWIEDGISLVHAHERQAAIRGGTAFGYDYSSLAHKKRNKRMEPFIFTFPAEIDMDTFFEHDGEEFVFMLRGKAQFETKRQDKIEKWTLDTGDSLYFDSRIPHRGRSLSGDSQALVVLFQPE
ncbi:MAG TPA: XRE family transcriptional regulator [Burkholderiales bacterium]